MDPRTMAFFEKATDGKIISGSGDVVVHEVFTDSRTPVRDGAFLAVRGDKFDGHQFIEQVYNNGCKSFIISELNSFRFPKDCNVLVVKDTVLAYGDIAEAYRDQFQNVVFFAVCGSNGKTTTKDLLASVLSKKGSVLASLKSFNNHIGVPQTLLKLSSKHRFAVLEIGTNHPGELEALLRRIKPMVTILTSIGHEHLEFFKNMEGVIKEEISAVKVLTSGGMLLINRDSYGYERIVGSVANGVKVISVSRNRDSSADWIGNFRGITVSGTEFSVLSAPKDYKVSNGAHVVQPLGKHNVTNALLAFAAGFEFGLDEQSVSDGLAACPVPEKRTVVTVVGERIILDDCYNANQDSMLNALETLDLLETFENKPIKSKSVILGTMGELGDSSVVAHLAVAEKVATMNLSVAIFCGEYATMMAEVVKKKNQMTKIFVFDSVENILSQLENLVDKCGCILIKASRFQKFEKIVKKLSEF